MSTTRCRSVHGVRVQKLTSKSITRASTTVRDFLSHILFSLHFFFALGSLEDLVRHGLHALRETLQQDKELNVNNTSIGIIGPAGSHETGVPPAGPFRILEGEKVELFLQSMVPKEPEASAAAPAAAAPAATTDEDVQMEG